VIAQEPTMPTITALYAGLLTILLIVLGVRVVLCRGASKLGLGEGDDSMLRKRVRVHGNAAENIPLALLLLLLLELIGTAPTVLHGFGVVLVLARVLHASGLSRSAGYSFGRFYGILGTWLAMLAMAGLLVVKSAIALM
jgi:uncharacterized protein